MSRVRGGEPRAAKALKDERARMLSSSKPAPMSDMAGIMAALNQLITGQESSEARLLERFEQQDRRMQELECQQEALTKQTQALLKKTRAVPQDVRDKATARMANEVQTQALNIHATMQLEAATVKAAIESEEKVMEYVPVPEAGYSLSDYTVQIGSYRYQFAKSGPQLMPASVAEVLRRRQRLTDKYERMQAYMITIPDAGIAEQMLARIEREVG